MKTITEITSMQLELRYELQTLSNKAVKSEKDLRTVNKLEIQIETLQWCLN